ncbi:hypothetical protein [Yinghuangia seranimata]|uniref:hypothetical protein n=1 Tax=Yinghuangia seranimata TaxID=408067 RepID=UPI00248B66DA|nr:hypothetical protein [Yinghuangia seranimata]MDI2126514.1 hypothetical protein [Yinghuangia seranimata]
MSVEGPGTGWTDADLVRFLEHPATRRDALGMVFERYHRQVLAFCAVRIDDRDRAVDAAADVFAELAGHFAAGHTVRQPLSGFLHVVARHRVAAAQDGQRPGLDALMFGENGEHAAPGHGLLETEDEAGLNQVRAALDNHIVPTFDPYRQHVFEYALRRGLYGTALAAVLRVSPERADDDAREVLDAAWRGFVSFALPGRDHDPRLLDPWRPVLVPVLCAAPLRARVEEVFDATAPAPDVPASSAPLGGVAGIATVLFVVLAVVVGVVTPPPHRTHAVAAAAATEQASVGPKTVQAAAVRAAMIRAQLATASVSARNFGARDWIKGETRLDVQTDGSANVRTLVGYDMGEGHPWNPPEVVLVGDRGWVTATDIKAFPSPVGTPSAVDGLARAADPRIDDARLARWMVSPANLVLLLDNAALTTDVSNADGTRTLIGHAPLAALAADPGGAFLYGPYLGRGPTDGVVGFVLVTDAQHLPSRLEFHVGVTVTPERAATGWPDPSDDPFSVNYTGWGQGTAVVPPGTAPEGGR